MADKKISTLTGASTPLAGTEVLPIVQSGSTVKVSVANLTAGRAVATAGGPFTDNITQSTAAKGVNFTANTPAAGMTSQLLNWYEEGTWTPASGVGTATSVSGTYTRIGRQVTVIGSLVFPVQTNLNQAQVTNLPFTISAAGSAGTIRYTNYGSLFLLYGDGNGTTISIYNPATGFDLNYTQLSGKRLDFTMTYFV